MTWYNASYPYRKLIHISGSNISGNLINFPCLWRVGPASDLSSHARSDGKDIIFVDSGTNIRVNCEIEKYLNGSGCIWFRIPSLTDKTIYNAWAYYGDGTDHSNEILYKPSGVWDNFYELVYHMEDATTSTVSDSTRNANNGNKTAANTPIVVDGVIGSGQRWRANTHGITTVNKINIAATETTMECWYKASSLGVLMNNRVNTVNYHSNDIANISSKNRLRYYTNNSANEGYSYTNTLANGMDSTWRYAAFTRDNTNLHLLIYVNGIEDETISDHLTAGGGYSEGNNYLTFGKDPLSTAATFGGFLDEVRFSNIRRSPGWIKTSYSSQKTAGFISPRAEEAYPTTPVVADISEVYLKSGFYTNEQFGKSVFYNNEQGLDTKRY